MKTVATLTATIWVGRREGYGDVVYETNGVKSWLQSYCDRVGLCVTVTETEFIYTHGSEPGLSIGLINYPRFPTDWPTLRKHALEIAKAVMEILSQGKVTIVFDGNINETVMITSEDLAQAA